MNCNFCGEPMDNGQHPLTESGVRSVINCQVAFLLTRNKELETKLDAETKRCQTGWQLANEMKADRDAVVAVLERSQKAGLECGETLLVFQKEVAALQSRLDPLQRHYDNAPPDYVKRLVLRIQEEEAKRKAAESRLDAARNVFRGDWGINVGRTLDAVRSIVDPRPPCAHSPTLDGRGVCIHCGEAIVVEIGVKNG